MKIRLFILIQTSLFALILSVSAVNAEKSQGYEECYNKCYAERCGVDGLSCQTNSVRSHFRGKCRGTCKEKMARQRRALALQAYKRRLSLERERANRFRGLLILKHKMWKDKKQLVNRLELNLKAAERARDHQKQQFILTKMRTAYRARASYMRQMMAAKSKFYLSRMRLRNKQALEMKRRENNFRLKMEKSRRSGNKERYLFYLKRNMQSAQNRLKFVLKVHQARSKAEQSKLKTIHSARMANLKEQARIKKEILILKQKHDLKKINVLRNNLAKKKKENKQLKAQERKQNLKYHVVMVNAAREKANVINKRRSYLNKQMKFAKQNKDSKSLRQLAQRLGKLAGVHAAAMQEVSIQKKKLTNAKNALY